MLDDEVEYIGTRIAKRASSVSDPLTHHRSVTGIALHIEKSGSAAAYDLVFHKAESSVVQIGRRPGTENDKHDPSKAMFRCPVVSRRHAKFTFTDAGSVYLFDLGSHHGTHVRKPEETISTPLLPESPHLLAGGEIVTLGKSVGKGEDLVRPVVFKVEIQYAPAGPSAQLIDLTRSASCERQSTPPKPCLLKSSGRYGLNNTSSSPSPSSSSSSADDMSFSFTNENSSDAEEVSSTSSLDMDNRSTPLPRVSHTPSHLGNAIEVLKSLIPPLHPPFLPSQRITGGQSPLFVFPPMHGPTWNSYCLRPRLPASVPCDLPPLSVALSEKTPDWDKPYGDELDDPLSDKSRSTSPMDLASPSPGPSNTKHTLVVGGWPRSRVASPVPSISSLYVECGRNPGTTAFCDLVEEQSPPLATEPQPITDVLQASLNQRIVEVQDIAPEYSPKVVNPIDLELGGLSVSLDNLKDEVAKLQLRQEDLKNHVDSNVSGLTDKLAKLEECMNDLDVGLSNVESSTISNASDMQAAQCLLSEVQHALAALTDATKSAAEAKQQVEPLDERQEVKEHIETQHRLISEMQAMRNDAQRQMNAELELVKAARELAVTNIQEMVASSTQSPSVPKSLKRKRDDGDDEGQESNEEHNKCDLPAQLDVTMDVVDEQIRCRESHTVNKAVGDDTGLDSTIEPNANGVIVPTRKRQRKKVASTILQTVTAVTLGAVATWSALAYT